MAGDDLEVQMCAPWGGWKGGGVQAAVRPRGDGEPHRGVPRERALRVPHKEGGPLVYLQRPYHPPTLPRPHAPFPGPLPRPPRAVQAGLEADGWRERRGAGKVAVSENPPLEMAYLYIYKKVGPA